MTMRPEDLRMLDVLLSRAANVCTMSEVYDGAVLPDTIGMRHDCDNVISPAVQMAEWEAQRGYRSTYYVLHTAPYWQDKRTLRKALAEIVARGHEIGLHNNAVAESLRTGRNPLDIIGEAVDELRGYGYTVRSTVGHGDQLCYEAKFFNDEMWKECRRPDFGPPARPLELNGIRLDLDPVPLSTFGFEFDSIWLKRGDYLSDPGGTWSQPLASVARLWPKRGQLHMLVHPDWWQAAFQKQAA